MEPAADCVHRARALHEPALEARALLFYASAGSRLRLVDECTAAIQRALDLAGDAPCVRGSGLALLAMIAHMERDLARESALLEEALELLDARRCPLDRLFTLIQAADSAVAVRDPERATALLDEADALLEPGNRLQRARSLGVRARVHWIAEDLDTAEPLLREALGLFQAIGARTLCRDVTNNLAEITRARGDLRGALALLEEANGLLADGRRSLFPALNRALLTLQLGRPDQAARQASGLLREVGAGEAVWAVGLLHMLQLPHAADQGQRDLWNALWAQGEGALERSGVVDPDIALVYERAAASAERAGWLDAAVRCRGRALSQRLRADQADEAAAQSQALEALARSDAPVVLGPYVLERRLGRGGMGEVWLGHDPATRTRAAVKVISGRQGADTEGAARGLERELRTVAGLCHPGIVDVLDFGRVGRAAAVMTTGTLPEGSPYVAMELVEGDTLSAVRGRMDWPRIRSVLLQILDALAHAHARDVVHLDLKPANVLMARTPLGPAVRLTDFGLAVALSRPDAPRRVVGSPRYMAPEQFLGRWRDFGPWTDLYALGCIGWALASGTPPFSSRKPARLQAAHVGEDPPPLAQATPVPVGLESWLRRLLAKAPHERYNRAADAAWALRALGAPTEGARAEAPSEGGASDTMALDDLLGLPDLPPVIASAVAHVVPPPVPEDGRGGVWRRTAPPALLPYRQVPVEGRRSEQAALWRVLRQTAQIGRGQVVEVSGAPGLGAQRLCRWLVQRATELGAATPLIAGSEGAPKLLLRFTRAFDLSGTPLLDHLVRRLQPWGASTEEIDRIAAAMEGEDPTAGLHALIRHAALRRAVLLWVRDAAGNAALLEALAALDDAPFPVLVLLTTDPTAPAAEADEALSELRAHATRIELGPIDGDAMRRLLGAVSLEARLERALARRAEGGPGFALGMLSAALEQGLLVDGPRGLRLRRGLSPDALPAPVGPWAERVAGVSAADRAALEVAAVLGSAVHAADWRAACGEAGVPWRPQLPGRMAQRQWLQQTEEGWAFTPGGVREALLQQLRGTRRWGRLHAASADAAEHISPEERARLLEHAGRLAEALEPLFEAARTHYDGEDVLAAEASIARWEAVALALALPSTDPRWSEGLTLYVQIAYLLEDFQAALDLAHRAVRAAEGTDREAAARVARALALVGFGRSEDAEADLVAALDAAEHDPALTGLCHWRLSFLHRVRGDAARTAESMWAAYAVFSELDDPRARARTHHARGVLAFDAAEFELATAELDAAVEAWRACGQRHRAAGACNVLVSLARYRHDFDRADACVARISELLEGALRLEHRVAQAMTALGRGDEQPWRDLLAANGPDALSRSGESTAARVLRAWSLPLDVGGTEEGFEQALARAAELGRRRTEAADLAAVAEIAAWRAVEHPDRALRCAELAAELWELVGRPDYAERARRG